MSIHQMVRNSQNGTWITQVCGRSGRSSSYAGSFATEEEAAREYDRIMLEEFSDCAVLNFPNDKEVDLVGTQPKAI